MTFSFTSHAKWILLGEHAVLRGHPAIVFPKKDYQLTLTYHPDKSPLRVSFKPHNITLEKAIKKLLEHEYLKRNITALRGHVTFDNKIPIGKGFGFSAALSICIAQLLHHHHSCDSIYLEAKSIEDYFHGQSSGLDIVGCMSDEPVLFQDGQFFKLHSQLMPNIRWIDSGPSKMSSVCINQVKRLFDVDPKLASFLDEKMHKATLLAKNALQNGSQEELVKAIHLGNECFEKWQLISPSMQADIDDQKAQGALACKPSGAGLGGLIIALFPNKS